MTGHNNPGDGLWPGRTFEVDNEWPIGSRPVFDINVHRPGRQAASLTAGRRGCDTPVPAAVGVDGVNVGVVERAGFLMP